MLSDDELVEQIQLGNENAAEELIKRYYTSILRYCRWHCSNLEKAEDLTQETFLKLFKNLSGYKGKKKFKAYLYTIANHLCIDESRKVEFSPLEDEENILECGIDITVQPPGKKLQNMMLLSGGEKAFTAIALLFAILKINPAPFCVLDEIEAALDDVNVYRFAEYLKKFADETQFLVITHRKGTMEAADTVYGITMEENGISKLLSMQLK